jgi:hypothetical protein
MTMATNASVRIHDDPAYSTEKYDDGALVSKQQKNIDDLKVETKKRKNERNCSFVSMPLINMTLLCID